MVDRSRAEQELARLKSRAINEFVWLYGSFPVIHHWLSSYGELLDFDALTKAILAREQQLIKRNASDLAATQQAARKAVAMERRRARGYPPTFTGLIRLLGALIFRR